MCKGNVSGRRFFYAPKRLFYKDAFLAHNMYIYHEEQQVEELENICKHYKPRLDGIECDVLSVSILFTVSSKGFSMFMGSWIQR